MPSTWPSEMRVTPLSRGSLLARRARWCTPLEDELGSAAARTEVAVVEARRTTARAASRRELVGGLHIACGGLRVVVQYKQAASRRSSRAW